MLDSSSGVVVKSSFDLMMVLEGEREREREGKRRGIEGRSRKPVSIALNLTL